MNILAIESAVSEGSIAILRDREPAVFHSGDGASRAERIMTIISVLLERAGISKHELDLIAVSSGPGSYSGIRIGMSTALGLRDALGIRSVGVPVLTAMSTAAPGDERVICAVPVGKSDVAWQPFGPTVSGKRKATDEPRLASSITFAAELASIPRPSVFAPELVFERVKVGAPGNLAFIDAGVNLAEYIGRYAADDPGSSNSMHPIYLRNQDGSARSF